MQTGKHIGWYESGIVYDFDNKILAFERNAKGLPYYPSLCGTPCFPGIPGKPGRPCFSGIPGRPGNRGFSNQDVLEYFKSND